MAKSRSKSHQDIASSETQAVSASVAEGRTENYDPVLVTLFAQSVGSIQIHFKCFQFLTGFSWAL